MADDVAAVIDHVGLERPVLVAWSYGGFIATDYVRAYGERAIAGLNLVGAAVVLAPPAFDHIGPAFLENAPVAAGRDLATSIAAVRRFLEACTAEPLSAEDWSAALCWTMVVPAEVRGALISREIRGDDVLAGLTIPVLVTHGLDDAIVSPRWPSTSWRSAAPRRRRGTRASDTSRSSRTRRGSTARRVRRSRRLTGRRRPRLTRVGRVWVSRRRRSPPRLRGGPARGPRATRRPPRPTPRPGRSP